MVKMRQLNLTFYMLELNPKRIILSQPVEDSGLSWFCKDTLVTEWKAPF